MPGSRSARRTVFAAKAHLQTGYLTSGAYSTKIGSDCLASACQTSYMSPDGFTQSLQVVTALKHRNNPARSEPVGQVHNLFSHFGKIAVFQQQPAKRIAAPRVEAGRDDDQIRRQLFPYQLQGIGERLAMRFRGGPFRKRNVQRESFAFAGAGLRFRSGAGIVRVLMGRKIIDRWI